jgi:hypothetical protein
VGSIPGRCFGSLAQRKVVWYWCNSPGRIVRKLLAYMTEILLGTGVKWNKQTNRESPIMISKKSIKFQLDSKEYENI